MIKRRFDQFEKLSRLSVELSSLSNCNGFYSLFLMYVKYITEILKGVLINMRLFIFIALESTLDMNLCYLKGSKI